MTINISTSLNIPAFPPAPDLAPIKNEVLNAQASITTIPADEETQADTQPLRAALVKSGRNALSALNELKTAHVKLFPSDEMAAFQASAVESARHPGGIKSYDEAKGNEHTLMTVLDDCLDTLDFSVMRNESHAANPSANQFKSDKELQEYIQKLIEDMEQSFRDPFMSAAEKMTAYYKLVTTIRDIIGQCVSTEKDDVIVKDETLFGNGKDKEGLLPALLKKLTDPNETYLDLYTATNPQSDADAKKEAEEWCKKMGVGKVVQVSPGVYKVVIDTAPLEDFIKNARSTLDDLDGSADDKWRVSQTVYNNFMAMVDNFLQQENTKTNKLTSQLEYYTKLLDNVRQTINQFMKDMCKLAETILGNGR